MTASEFRAQARKALAGKWGKVALTTLIYAILIIVLEFVLALIPVVGPIILTVITLPLSYGMIVTYVKIKNGEETTYTEFFTNGFNSFARAWKTSLWIFVKLLVPFLLVVVAYILVFVGAGMSLYSAMTVTSDSISPTGSIISIIGTVLLVIAMVYMTVKYFLYALSYFVLNDRQDLLPKQAVEESARLMQGHRGQFFWLCLSFIGWMILSVIAFGLGYLWVLPYIVITQAFFYEYLAGKKQNEPEIEINDDNNGDAIKENF